MASTLKWLRGRTDAQLADLLAARPDLLLPAPGDLAVLARRLDSPATSRRAVESLDAFQLQLVHALLILQTADRAEPAAAIAEFLGGPAGPVDVTTAADRLVTAGLLRAGDGGYRLPGAIRDALGEFPAGLGPPSGLRADQLAAALGALGVGDKDLLERLAPGPPIGILAPGSARSASIAGLVDTGLLRRMDDRTVLLPREVGLALRGAHPLGAALSQPPHLATRDRPADTVNGAAAGQALAAHTRAMRLLESAGTEPFVALKAGGIGILALRRLAKSLGVEVHIVALHLELLAAAGLLAPVLPRSGGNGSWVPTEAADGFLRGDEPAGWTLLVMQWLSLRRDPARVGARDLDGKICNALAPEAGWRSGPVERRQVLGELAALPAGSGAEPSSLAARSSYRAPLRDPAAISAVVTGILAEATELGLVAFDALSTPGRAALAGDADGATVALERTLPPPVDTLLVQADLTVVAPGRLTGGLARALAGAADVESAGGATVYRVSESSLRRALDGGATAAELHDLFEKHAAAPVPQAIQYLIDDVARRHGVLRAGSAACYLRSEDPALISQAVAAAGAAGICLRALAPTVAVTAAEPTALIEALRAAGLIPVAENAAGSVVDLRPRPLRTRARPPIGSPHAEPPAPSPQQIADVVQRMRAGDNASADQQHPGEISAVLRTAARHRTAVWIAYADAEGGTHRRLVEPIVVSGGAMVAYDRLRRAPRTFTIHRISSAQPGDSPEGGTAVLDA